MAFIARGEGYRFFVNGIEVPISLDAADRARIEEYIGRFRYWDTKRWHGDYGRFGSAKIVTSEGQPPYKAFAGSSMRRIEENHTESVFRIWAFVRQSKTLKGHVVETWPFVCEDGVEVNAVELGLV